MKTAPLEFKNIKVSMAKPLPPGSPAAAQAPREPEVFTVPADREITIRDLMTHTSGLESGGIGTREGNRIAPRQTSDTLAHC